MCDRRDIDLVGTKYQVEYVHECRHTEDDGRVGRRAQILEFFFFFDGRCVSGNEQQRCGGRRVSNVGLPKKKKKD